jgi:hypothetical protein
LLRQRQLEGCKIRKVVIAPFQVWTASVAGPLIAYGKREPSGGDDMIRWKRWGKFAQPEEIGVWDRVSTEGSASASVRAVFQDRVEDFSCRIMPTGNGRTSTGKADRPKYIEMFYGFRDNHEMERNIHHMQCSRPKNCGLRRMKTSADRQLDDGRRIPNCGTDDVRAVGAVPTLTSWLVKLSVRFLVGGENGVKQL